MSRPGVTAAAVGALDMLEELKDRSADAYLPITSIKTVPQLNPRRLLGDQAFTKEALADLAANIRKYGVLQPLLVRRRKAEILLVAGERRLRAAKLAGLTQVPVMFVEADDAKAYEIAIVENSQRHDLDLVTESLVGFEYLSQRLGMSVDAVVAYLHNVRKGRREDEFGVEQILREMYGTGISVWGQQRAQILKMNAAERTAIQQKQVDAKVCAELVALPDEAPRAALLRRAIEEGLTTKQMRDLVRRELESRRAPRSPLSVRVASLKKVLPKATRLKGEQALRAEQLITELESLLSNE